MLDLVHLAVEADRLAEEARKARCCDALRPCRTCMARRRHVVARRLVIAFPRRPLRAVAELALAPACAMQRLAS
jgi:hypothetical protein